MWWTDFKNAFTSMRSAKIRSALTMLGIIIGVTSVVTIVSLGEGLKSAINEEVGRFGADLFQVNPGNVLIRDEQGNIKEFNFAALLSGATLTEQDLQDIRQVGNVRLAAPQVLVDSTIQAGTAQKEGSIIIGTTPPMIDILNQQVTVGEFLNDKVTNPNVAVVGHSLAMDLFQTEQALGRKFEMRGQEFTVIGVLEEYKSALGSLGFSQDFNSAMYIPFETAKTFNQGLAIISEIDVKVENVDRIDETIAAVSNALKENRGGEENFSISKPDEFLDITDQILSQVTLAVSSIALISVIVGGIGIMNIMFVSVTERTREIGIRKSIGATNRQILGQFLVEAMTISLVGAFIGILISLLIALGVSTFTDFTPVVTLPFIVIAVVASLVVGVVSGIAPAIKAARKDPIDALRYE